MPIVCIENRYTFELIIFNNQHRLYVFLIFILIIVLKIKVSNSFLYVKSLKNTLLDSINFNHSYYTNLL